MKKYRIVSDGTPEGTFLYDPDGKEISNALEVHYAITAEDVCGTATIVVPAEMELEIPDRDVDVVGSEDIDKEIDTLFNDVDINGMIRELAENIRKQRTLKERQDKARKQSEYAFYRDRH
jgi:hypothetical protein